MAEAELKGSRLGAILRATSGNFLEQFDFFLFGFYASAISKAFFPSDSEVTSLMLAFTTFWLGALMRPVGAIVLGSYLDRIGRRQGLIVTLAIMAAGRAFPQASKSAACRSICSRSRRRAIAGFTRRSSPAVSRSRS